MLTDEVIDEICMEAGMLTSDFDAAAAKALRVFLKHRRDSLKPLILANKVEFKGIPDTDWPATS